MSFQHEGGHEREVILIFERRHYNNYAETLVLLRYGLREGLTHSGHLQLRCRFALGP